MKTFLNLMTCLFMAHSTHAGSSEAFSFDDQVLAQFFEPIDQTIQDNVFEEKKSSLNQKACIGKRYRIVKANLGLMVSNGKAFVMNPFDDVRLVVKTKELRNFSNGTAQIWVMDKVNSRMDIDISGMTPNIKEWINTVRLTVNSSRYEEPLQTPQQVTGVGISQNPSSRVIRSKRYVWGQMSAFNNIYYISPVTERAEYYLVVQQNSVQRLKKKRTQKRCGVDAYPEEMS